jgi:glycosyltransferase involved in cell wall biosynthesis
MIEAMACGTPVLAFRQGSVPEIVEDGITGYTVISVEEAICSIGRVLALDRGRVRRRFESSQFSGPVSPWGSIWGSAWKPTRASPCELRR